MIWTQTTDTGSTWNTKENQASEWDSGASLWDQNSNVAKSLWDQAADTSWTDSTDTGTVWT